MARDFQAIGSYRDFLSRKWEIHKSKKTDNMPTVISLFAGAGGSSLGYSMAGYNELLMAEWDDHSCECFAKNFDHVEIFNGDVGQLAVNDIKKSTGLIVGDLDILDGSPPCQGFSTAGSRNQDDSRNKLFLQFVRILRGLKPKVFVMENVKGMTLGKARKSFDEICTILSQSGYTIQVRVLNAAYLQVPQLRERVIFVGVRNDLNLSPAHPKPLYSAIPAKDAINDMTDDDILGKVPSQYKTALYHNTEPGLQFGKITKRVLGVMSNFNCRRLDWNRPSFTLTKGCVSEVFHPDVPRILAVKPLVRFGSFPDEYEWVGSEAKIGQRIGNSVPPLLMYHIAKTIREEIISKYADNN